MVYIISGQIDFYVEDQVHRLGPGWLLVVSSNPRHWGEVVRNDPVINLDVFMQHRTEYA